MVQELWRGEGDLGEFFYMALLSPDVTPVYGYVVPKGGGAYLVGVGVYPWQEAEAQAYLGRFKAWLSGNLRFKAGRLLRRESGAVPFDEPAPGSGGVVLVGDAAGLTNSFSGEGIRQAVESGLAAAESIDEAFRGLGRLGSLYADKIGYHLEAARRSRTIIPADAKSREEFVEAELRRGLRALLRSS
ncbi:MAG TPA: hypothetical protein EYP90_12115 [Chromatiaceae bacterium]|nr:hypothetical protein [Chromatiaceae bacterium]